MKKIILNLIFLLFAVVTYGNHGTYFKLNVMVNKKNVSSSYIKIQELNLTFSQESKKSNIYTCDYSTDGISKKKKYKLIITTPVNITKVVYSYLKPGDTTCLEDINISMSKLSLKIQKDGQNHWWGYQILDSTGAAITEKGTGINGWGIINVPSGKNTIVIYDVNGYQTELTRFSYNLKEKEKQKTTIELNPQYDSSKTTFYESSGFKNLLSGWQAKTFMQKFSIIWVLVLLFGIPFFLILSIVILINEKKRGIHRQFRLSKIAVVCGVIFYAWMIWSKGITEFEWSWDFVGANLFSVILVLMLIAIIPAGLKRKSNINFPADLVADTFLGTFFITLLTTYSYSVVIDSSTGSVISDGEMSSFFSNVFIIFIIGLILAAIFPLYILWKLIRNYLLPAISDLIIASIIKYKSKKVVTN